VKRRILIVFLFVTNLFAGGFENLGVHSRVIGLGGAFVGVGDESYTVFYNPSGLAFIRNFQVSSTYNQLFSGINDELYYLTFSSTAPIWNLGDLGVGLTHLKAGAWQENTLILSYAKNISHFAIGGSLKVLRWSAQGAPGEDSQSYTGFTFDIGAFYKLTRVFGNGVFKIGAVAQDLTQPSIAVNGSDEAKLPLKIAVGVSYYSPTYDYLFAIDAVKENDITILRFGAEFLGYKDKVYGIETGFYLRGGYNEILTKSNFQNNALNGGFGVFVGGLKIDYAYVNKIKIVGIGGSHKISIGYHFN